MAHRIQMEVIQLFLEFPQNVISKEITSSKVPICPIFEKNEKTVL